MHPNTVAKIYFLGVKEKFQILEDKGFNKAKTCGPGTNSFITVLALNYIESMILRQKMIMSNIIFIQSFIESVQQDPNYPLLSKVFAKLNERNADHLQFAKDSLESPELINEIFKFSLYLFKIPSPDPSIDEIIQHLYTASAEFNLQFMFFNKEAMILEIKKNRFMFPLVLNFFFNQDNCELYLLYHINYKEISFENFNISNEYDSTNSHIDDKAQEDLMKEQINQLSKLNNIEEDDKAELNSILSLLVKIDAYGYEAASLLKHLVS